MAKYCVLFIALPLPVIVRMICLFDSFEKFEKFEKLSMLLGFSRDVLEGWGKVFCVHVFLALLINLGMVGILENQVRATDYCIALTLTICHHGLI